MDVLEQFDQLIQKTETLSDSLSDVFKALFVEGKARYSEGKSISTFDEYHSYQAIVAIANESNFDDIFEFLKKCRALRDEKYSHDLLRFVDHFKSDLHQKKFLNIMLPELDVLPPTIAQALKDFFIKITTLSELLSAEYIKTPEAKVVLSLVKKENFKETPFFLTKLLIDLEEIRYADHLSAPNNLRQGVYGLIIKIYKRKEVLDDEVLRSILSIFGEKEIEKFFSHQKMPLFISLLTALETLKSVQNLSPELLSLVKTQLVNDDGFVSRQSFKMRAEIQERLQHLFRYEDVNNSTQDDVNQQDITLIKAELPLNDRAGVDKWYGSEPDKVTWPSKIRLEIQQLSHAEQRAWYALWDYAATAKSSAPSAAWMKKSQSFFEPLKENFVERMTRWFALMIEKAPAEHPPFSDRNTTTIKGLLWMCPLSESGEIAQMVGAVVQFSYTKLYGVGPRSSSVANAGLYALGSLGNAGIVQLSKLRSKVKYSVGANLIEKMLREAALRQGVTTDDLEEMVVPELDMDQDAKQIFSFSEYQATLNLVGAKQLTVIWQDKNGKILKAPPASVKKDHADDFKEFKQITAEVETIISGQSTRLEQNILKDRQWIFNTWQERFIQHAILGWLGRRVIWQFDDQGVIQHGLWLNQQLVNSQGEALQPISDNAQVKIWHPIFSDMNEIQAWRELIRANQIIQPFKQAFREVYLLTPAEEQTETYSNRFAGHFLKQFQLVALCRERGWSYQLQGGWDGANDPAFVLPHWNIRVRLELSSDMQGSPMNATGVYQYVLTEKAFFYHQGESLQPINMKDIPTLVFSEVMRDLDLFVGVCSAGLDPNLDLTNPQIQRYFNDFNTSELTATAQVRKSVLDNIISKLEIAPLCRFEGKYLIVKGTLRSYKIHLGSGNILMEPNDQYLCIVQDGKKGDTVTDGLYLPFEGDHLLSIILSKALLLAADNKIKDQSILAQIKGR